MDEEFEKRHDQMLGHPKQMAREQALVGSGVTFLFRLWPVLASLIALFIIAALLVIHYQPAPQLIKFENPNYQEETAHATLLPEQ